MKFGGQCFSGRYLYQDCYFEQRLRVKKYDASLRYFTSKFELFFIQVIETVYELLFSTSPYGKCNLKESCVDPTGDVKGIFLDISKAFDKLWHEGLLLKLKMYGVKGELLNLLRNYLHQRNQRVVLNGQISS